jgi:DNA-binding NtrC family response regulator
MAAHRARIAVIDDDERLGKLLYRVLADEHEVVVLSRAQEALDRIATGDSFDLFLCDLILPGMSGEVFHQRVAAVAPALVARIVFITGGPCTPSARTFLQRADIRHIAKPFVVAALRVAVQEHLRRVGGP